MPEAGRFDREEQFEEEEKKFPVWIIPLVAGPVVLIILVAVLAGGQTTTNGQRAIFDEVQLTDEALEYYNEASKLYFDAQRVGSQRQKDQLYDKALKISAKAMDNLNVIRKYYDDHNIQHKGEGTCWSWEKIEQDLSQLRVDILRDRGMTGYTSQSP